MSKLNDNDRSLTEALAETKKDIFSFSEWVDVPKGKKSDKLVLCVGKYRVFLCKMHKKKAEIVAESCLVNMKCIELSDKELKFHQHDGISWALVSGNVTEIITHIKSNLSVCFPDVVDEIFEWKLGNSKLNLDPPKRTTCGNFIQAYAIMCDLDCTPLREDIVWDIDNIFGAYKKEFSFKEFEIPISEKDIRCLFMALKYNRFFTSLDLESDDQIPIEKELGLIADVMRNNNTLNKLRLSKLKGIEEKIWCNIFSALQQNSTSALTSIEIDECHGDGTSKITTSMCAWVSGNKNITEITIRNTGIIKKTATLFEALLHNSHLKRLDIEGLKINANCADNLNTFLSKNKSLLYLNVANTGVSLPPLFDALSEGKSPLKYLNISGVKLQKKQIIQPVLDYLLECDLEEFDIGSTEFPDTVLEKIISTIFQNKNFSNLSLIMNNIKLEKEGAEIISKNILPNQSIKKWSLKNCELGDEGIRILLKSLEQLQNLYDLDLSFNLKHPKTPLDKDRETTMNCLADFLNSKSCTVHTFKIAGQKGLEIGQYLKLLLKQIGENCSVLNLDISGNNSGDEGALALSKVFQRNNFLQQISFDKNGTTYRGLQWIKLGITKNSSLRYFEAPLYDIGAVGNDSEGKNRLVTIWRDIEDLLRKRGGGGGGGGVVVPDKLVSTPHSTTLQTSIDESISSGKEDSSTHAPSKPVPSIPEKEDKSLGKSTKEDSSHHHHKATKQKSLSRISKKSSKDSSSSLLKSTGHSGSSSSLRTKTTSSLNKSSENDSSFKASGGVQGLAAIIGGSLGEMKAPHSLHEHLHPSPIPQSIEQPDKSNIVQDDSTGIAYSVAPRLPNTKRVKGPVKRPPKSGNISGSIAEKNDDDEKK